MPVILNKTHKLISDFDSFLDAIGRSALIFKALMVDYLRSDSAGMSRHIQELRSLEADCDQLRREIRFRLYSRMLIPENRGDVLSILENADRIIDTTKKVAVKLEIEEPQIPEFLRQGMRDLSDSVSGAVDFTVQAAKAYLKTPGSVQDLLSKVHFHEHEADELEDSLKRAVFADQEEKRLSAKMQLSLLIEGISSIADTAEDVSDRISVAAIKREF